jgi:hypothetical protein
MGRRGIRGALARAALVVVLVGSGGERSRRAPPTPTIALGSRGREGVTLASLPPCAEHVYLRAAALRRDPELAPRVDEALGALAQAALGEGPTASALGAMAADIEEMTLCLRPEAAVVAFGGVVAPQLEVAGDGWRHLPAAAGVLGIVRDRAALPAVR